MTDRLAEQYGPCPTRLGNQPTPSARPWRYAHAASIEGAHWDIYAGEGIDGWLVGMVTTEADAALIVDAVNAAGVSLRSEPGLDEGLSDATDVIVRWATDGMMASAPSTPVEQAAMQAIVSGRLEQVLRAAGVSLRSEPTLDEGLREPVRALIAFFNDNSVFTYGDATESWSRIDPDLQMELEERLLTALEDALAARGTNDE